MAIAHVQSGGATAASFSFGSTIGSGHTVCALVYANGVTGAVTLTDDKSNSYTQVTSIAPGGTGVWVFFAANLTNGPKTLTATSSGATFNIVAGDEFSGVSNQPDGYNAAGGAPVASTGTWTTAVNGDLVWGGLGLGAGLTWSPGSGFTAGFVSGSGTGGGTLYQVQTTASTSTAVTVSTAFQGGIAGFALMAIPTFTLVANDVVETAAFNLTLVNSLHLAANDVVETAAFTMTASTSFMLAANDVVESAAFDVVTIPASTSGYSIIPLTGT